jgi:hypothetical protein
MQIYAIAKLVAEARAAAQTYSNINDCCPYPFDTDAAHIYRNAFLAARHEIELAISTQAATDIKQALDQCEAIT